MATPVVLNFADDGAGLIQGTDVCLNVEQPNKSLFLSFFVFHQTDLTNYARFGFPMMLEYTLLLV